jgi:hypothetical protein
LSATNRYYAESERRAGIQAIKLCASYRASNDHTEGRDCLDNEVTQHLADLGCVAECIPAWPGHRPTFLPYEGQPLPSHPYSKQSGTGGQHEDRSFGFFSARLIPTRKILEQGTKTHNKIGGRKDRCSACQVPALQQTWFRLVSNERTPWIDTLLPTLPCYRAPRSLM